MAVLYQYNGTNFDDGSTFVCLDWDSSGVRRVSTIFSPRADKGTPFDAGAGLLTHHLHIAVIGSTQAIARTNLHTLRKAFFSGTNKLRRNDDKYWSAYVKDYGFKFDAKSALRYCEATFAMECPDPFLYYDAAPAPTTWNGYANPSSVSDTRAITNAGDAYAECIFTLTGPLAGPIVVTRTAPTSQSFTYSGSLTAGQVLIVNTATRQVTLAGAVSFTSFSGDATTGGFMTLESGANSVQLVCANGNNTGSMVLSYSQRDLGWD